MAFDLFGLTLSSLLLVFSTRYAITAFEKLAIKLKINPMVLAAMLVALSTSLPEFFVGVASALEGSPEISLGNVLGSNVANLSLVIGGAALIGGSVSVVGEFMRREFVSAYIAGLLPLALMMDGRLSRIDGVLLLLTYVIYIRDVIIAGKEESLSERGGRKIRYGLLTRLKVIHKNNIDLWVLKLLGAMAVVIVSADLLVRFAEGLAVSLGVPIFLVSLLIVAVGTSLPEFFLGLQAIRKKEVALVFGDLLGGTAANSTLVLGITILLAPIEVISLSKYVIAGLMFVAVFSLFWAFSMTKKRLDRWEAVVLIGFYIMFVGLELLMGSR